MHEKPIVSIVIPFYDCASYVERCLKSLSGVKGIEIIAVDDGSKDETLSVLQACERKIETLKVYHKENGGVSSARNFGIQHCTGQYLTFVDGDDAVNTDVLQAVVDYISTAEKNLYVFPILRGDETDKFFKESYFEKFKEANDSKAELYKLVIQGRSNELVTKIFRTDIIQNNALKLDTRMFMGEDVMFFIDYLIALDELKLEYLDMAYYYYYRNNSSVTSNIRKGFPSQEQRRYRHVKELIRAKGLSEEFAIANDSFYLHKLIYFVSEMNRNGVSKKGIQREIKENGIDKDIIQGKIISVGDRFRQKLFLSLNVCAMRFFVSCITIYHTLTEKRSKLGEN